MATDKEFLERIRQEVMAEFGAGKAVLIPPGAYLATVIKDKPKLASDVYSILFGYVVRKFIRGKPSKELLAELQEYLGLSVIGMYRLLEEVRRLTVYANLVFSDSLAEKIALKQMMTWQHVDKKIIPKLWEACKAAYEAEHIRHFEVPDDIDDDLRLPDGDISEGTFSTSAPHVKPHMLRLIWCDGKLKFVVGIGSAMIALFFVLLVVNVYLFTEDYTVSGFVTLPFTLLSIIAAGYAKELLPKVLSVARDVYGSGLMTVGMIEKTQPLTVLYFANMGTGMGPKCWGIRREMISTLPVHSHEAGTLFPCVSSFDGGMFSLTWEDFYPRPIAWGTGNIHLINDLMLKVDLNSIAQLKACVAKGILPEGNGRVLLLSEELQPMIVEEENKAEDSTDEKNEL